MTAQGIFIDQNRLRPIWRFLISAVAIVAGVTGLQIGLGLVLGVTGIEPEFFMVNTLSSILTFPVLLGIVAVLTRKLDHRPVGSSGIALRGQWKQEFGQGLAVGGLMILFVAGLEWALGAAKFSWSGESLTLLMLWGGGGLMALLFAASNEEMVFRGYPFQRLVESMGAVGAILVLSLMFGAIHLGNPNRTWVSTANTALVGIPFSIAYLRTRMLWLPIGMHFSWNFGQGFVLGLPVSGISFPVSVLRAEVSGPAMLTGGAYGPEAGLLATGIIIISAGYLALSPSVYTSDDTRALVLGPAVTGETESSELSAEAPGPAR
jgi:membrane protease YdiL (CAAX protease family)